jgi:hypothetical protein
MTKLNTELVKTKFVPGEREISKSGKRFQKPGHYEIDYSVRCAELTRWQVEELVYGAGKYRDKSAAFLCGFTMRIRDTKQDIDSDEVAAETLAGAYREWQLDLDYPALLERFQQQYENWQMHLQREYMRLLAEAKYCNRIKIWDEWFCFEGGRLVYESAAQNVEVDNG